MMLFTFLMDTPSDGRFREAAHRQPGDNRTTFQAGVSVAATSFRGTGKRGAPGRCRFQMDDTAQPAAGRTDRSQPVRAPAVGGYPVKDDVVKPIYGVYSIQSILFFMPIFTNL